MRAEMTRPAGKRTMNSISAGGTDALDGGDGGGVSRPVWAVEWLTANSALRRVSACAERGPTHLITPSQMVESSPWP